MNINEAGVSRRSVRYFFTPSSYAERLFFYPTRIGHYFCDRNYQFSCNCEIAMEAGHRVNYMLFLVVDGHMDIELEGERFSASPGDLVLFDCKKPHEYRARDDEMEFFWLLFNGGQSDSLYGEILSLRGGHVFPSGDPAQVRLLFERLITYGEMPGRGPEHTLSETVYALLCELLAAASGPVDDFDALIDRALRYMDGHYNGALSVEAVAAHIGLSASYFTKQFRKRTGYSPYEYISLRRIDRAKELLLAGGRTVGQIAFETGFNSEENFIRAFKKKVGVTPSAFRQYPI